MGSADPSGKIDEKLKSENMQKSSLLCLCYILRAIGTGRCRQRRYADHIFIQIYFRMHNFVVKFSKFSSPQVARGHWPPYQNPADVPASSPGPVLPLLGQLEHSSRCQIRAALCWVAFSIGRFRVAYSWPLCADVASNVKPEVHKVSQRHRRKTEPQP